MTLGHEDRLHTWLRRRLRRAGFDRLGDDGAMLPAGGPWAVTQDHQIQDVHFPAGLDPRLIARRLLAVNLSDLAAMGAKPAFAFLALSCPPSFDARRLLEGLIVACARFEVELAGGDLARNDSVTTALTLIGELPLGSRWVTRANAKPGDRLWLAGSIGMSALGRHLLERGATIDGRRVVLPSLEGLSAAESRFARRAVRCHVEPRPQMEVGAWLGTLPRAAAIDVSDGVAIDLHRLCRQSGVGAKLEAESLSTSNDLRRLCQKLGLSEHHLVLGGGEDYALLFSLPAAAKVPASLKCRPIGVLTRGSGLWVQRNGKDEPLPPAGWDHFAAELRASETSRA